MMPPQRHRGGGGPTDLMDADISFPLGRLFDRFNLDHIPERKHMDEFEHRDLAHIKHYKAAVKIFGGPLSRKRVMIAPPMETPMKHRLGLYLNKRTMPSAPELNTDLKPQKPFEKPEPEEIIAARAAREREDEYKSWFKERQKFRNDLENMGLNLKYLSSKPNKTVLEQRVLKQLNDAEKKDTDMDNESESGNATKTSREDMADSDTSSIPQLKMPAPLGIKILNQHLKQNKLRLIDLFTAGDKNKDWRISREEFLKICDEKNIPISQGLLEDMLISLDMNLDEYLDYKEMAVGLELARRELREDRRKELTRESTKLTENSEPEEKEDCDSPVSSGKGSRAEQNSAKSSAKRVRTLDTTTSTRTLNNSSHTVDKRQNSSTHTAEKRQSLESPKNTSVTSAGTKVTVQSSEDKNKDKKSLDTSSTTTRSRSRSERNENLEMVKNQTAVSFGSKITKSTEDKSQMMDAKSNLAHDRTRSEQTGSPMFLEPPPTDCSRGRLVLGTDEEMVDLRKRDREGLKGYNAKLEGIPPTILTGNKAIDDHSMQSTLTGGMGDMVDKFRQQRLKEYFAITRLCKDNNVPLSEKLLERVLLYPPDRPHSDQQKIRQPDSAPLHSRHMADPPKRPRTPIEVKHRDKLRRSKSGKLLIDSRHQYPMSKRVSDVGFKQSLSTGRAVIRRKTDCWMTFEEYEDLTRHLAVRYQHLHGNGGTNAFWPGHLLDKIRLCMPPYDGPQQRDKESAIFTRSRRTPAVNYGYEPVDAWPTNSDLYTQIGIHDPYKNKVIY